MTKRIEHLPIEDLDGEIWRQIPGYEGLYVASNKGRIKSCERYNSRNTLLCERLLKPKINRGGYLTTALTKNEIRKEYMVHRLVAMAFIPNPDKLPQINHKDENRKNNYLENLEWCTSKYNINYGNSISKRSNAVLQINDKGEIVARYKSGFEASRRNNISRTLLYNALAGKVDTAGGYKWKYEDNEKNIIADEIRKRREVSHFRRAVVQYSQKGKEIGIFDNITRASEAIGVSVTAIRQNCLGYTETCKGYKFKYKN